MATKNRPICDPTGHPACGTWSLCTLGVNGGAYGLAEGLGATDRDAAPDALAAADAVADPLGAAVMLGSGAGVGDGKRVVGTLATERAKIRMKMTSTTSTQGRASASVRGGSDPR